MKIGNPIRNIQRWREVQAILLRYGFGMLIDREEIQDVRRVLHDKLRLPVGEFDNRGLPERVRLMLTELGPTYVKLGQILSSRTDLLPEDWIAELAKLQDSVAPFPYEQVRQIIQAELGALPEDIYRDFEPEPMAAASIGQVHLARLPVEGQVVVKIQRPEIVEQIQADCEMMHNLAHLAETRTAWGRQYGVSDIVQEFTRTLTRELDYQNEARNADRLRRNLAAIPHVHVPVIYWNLVTPRVLTMEAIRGIKINDLEALDAAHVDRVALADVFIRSIFQQLLIDGFFHADPHPGNLFVEPEDDTLVFLDLGMMGVFLEEQRNQLSNLVQAVLRHDSREVTRLVMTIGTPYKPVREPALRRDVDQIIERYLTAALSEISFAALLTELLTTIFGHGIRLPGELTLGIKTLIQAEMVARTLNPKIRVTDVLQSVVQQILWHQFNPRVLGEQISGKLQELLHILQIVPGAAATLLKQIEDGAVRVQVDLPLLEQSARPFQANANRQTLGILLAGLLIGSAIAMGVPPQQTWGMIPVLGAVGFTVGIIVSVGVVIVIFWDLLRGKK
jgi:ubiquinone biosynthesis protein